MFCQTCGTLFYASWPNAKYCSRACTPSSRPRKFFPRHCDVCGNELIRYRQPCGRLEATTYFKKRRFCSRLCQYVWQAQEGLSKRQSTPCKKCEKPIFCADHGGHTVSFCSNECKQAYRDAHRKPKPIKIPKISDCPLDIRGIKLRDMTSSERSIYNNWRYQKRKNNGLGKYNKRADVRLKRYLRTRIWKALNIHKKSASTLILVGCSQKQLRQHIERQFKWTMTWENMGKWHIDHIIPCSAFDLSRADEQRRCFHFTNLRPIWAKQNRKKHNRITHPQLSLCL